MLHAMRSTSSIYLERVQLLLTKLDQIYAVYLPQPLPAPATLPDLSFPASTDGLPLLRTLDSDTQTLLREVVASDYNQALYMQ